MHANSVSFFFAHTHSREHNKTRRKRPRVASMSTPSNEAALEALLAPLQSLVVVSSVDATTPPARLIGTHSGTFHCDEALACGLLLLLPAFAGCSVVRSRDACVLARCGVLVDVGGIYDPSTQRFDHHQPGFTSTYSGEASSVTRLSSAGLVFKHFGSVILARLVEESGAGACTEAMLSALLEHLYATFVLEIDAVDNGVDCAVGPLRYALSTGLSSRVGRLNPAWNEACDESTICARFRAAVLLCTREFVEAVFIAARQWLPARDIVRDALAGAGAAHASLAVICLARFCPWREHLFELEAEAGVAGRSLFAVYQDSTGAWRVQAVPAGADSFAVRRPLPAAWAGLRDAALVAACGIPGASFVHTGRFIGGHATREGALAMAAAALLA